MPLVLLFRSGVILRCFPPCWFDSSFPTLFPFPLNLFSVRIFNSWAVGVKLFAIDSLGVLWKGVSLYGAAFVHEDVFIIGGYSPCLLTIWNGANRFKGYLYINIFHLTAYRKGTRITWSTEQSTFEDNSRTPLWGYITRIKSPREVLEKNLFTLCSKCLRNFRGGVRWKPYSTYISIIKWSPDWFYIKPFDFKSKSSWLLLTTNNSTFLHKNRSAQGSWALLSQLLFSLEGWLLAM